MYHWNEVIWWSAINRRQFDKTTSSYFVSICLNLNVNLNFSFSNCIIALAFRISWSMICKQKLHVLWLTKRWEGGSREKLCWFWICILEEKNNKKRLGKSTFVENAIANILHWIKLSYGIDIVQQPA